jgi:single-stranded-DNA-specific exonuclease
MNGKAIVENRYRPKCNSADARDANFTPDDLVTQLLLARGVARDDLERHRNPTLRAFMPDPSLFQDMDRAERLAVERRNS